MKKYLRCTFVLSVSILALSVFASKFQEASSRLQTIPQLKGEPGANIQNSNLTADLDFGRMPIYFIANEGQMDKQVAYYVQGKDKTIYFTPGGITLALTKTTQKKELPSPPDPGRSILDLREESAKAQDAVLKSVDTERRRGAESGPERWVVKLEFVGADKNVKPIGEAETGAVVSYFKGKPAEWRTGLPSYSKVVYPNLWPGIDLIYYGTVNRLKYEFIVHPGGDPSKIHLAYRGVEGISVDGEGRLKVTTAVGAFTDDVPGACQERSGKRVDIKLAYKMDEAMDRLEKLDRAGGEIETEACSYGFELGEYDRSLPLVLDPAILVYCGYIGGSANDSGWGIAVDGSGNVYVTGGTASSEATFPVAVGPDLTLNGSNDAFVAKINAFGTALIYCGYIGGSSSDGAGSIAVDGSGNAYVTGSTGSTEATFPVKVGPDLTYNGGGKDVFVAKINAFGTALIYCGYIGGSSDDSSSRIAVDGSGNAYVTGSTVSTEASFPVKVGPDLSHNGGGWDAFVAKVNASGTALVYCGYIGGSATDTGRGIAVDGSGNAYVAGDTASTEATFPVKVGPDLTFNGGSFGDAFVAKVNASGTALVYCGYIGGSSDEVGSGIALDGSGNAYVTGYTVSTEATFPVKVGPDLTWNGGNDVFVAKVNATGTALVYCGYIGGSSGDIASAIAVDGSGNAYVIGWTPSTEATFPVKIGPDLTYNGGGSDTFVAMVNASGTALVYCGYIGGSTGYDEGLDIAVDGSGNAYVIGLTESTETTFPVKVGPDLTFNGGSNDGFVAKISEGTGVLSITVSSPHGGESWPSGSAQNIMWTSAGGVGNVKIEYSTDGGVSYSVIASSTANDGSYIWFVPNRPSTTCMVRISETDGSPSSTSASMFTITAGGGGFSSPSNQIILPECIWAPATGGGTWVSEVQVTDLTGGSAVSVYFSSGGGAQRGPVVLWNNTSGGSRSIKFSNLLQYLASVDPGFSYYGKVGAVEFLTQDSSHFIQVGARTLNGNYSKTFPAVFPSEENTAAVSRPMMIQDFTNNSVYRSTCGFYNPTEDWVLVDFRLYDGNGAIIGSPFSRSFVGYDFMAFSPFTGAGVPYPAYTYDNVYLVITPTSGSGSLVCFGASANNSSNDPAAHIAVQYQGTYACSPAQHIILPECIWAPATGGGTWVTELQISAIDSGTVVSAFFYYGTSSRLVSNLWTSPGVYRSVKFANILSTMQALDPSFSYYGRVGTLWLYTQDASHRIQAQARTVNGDYGKTFPGLRWVDSNAANLNRPMMITNLTQNATYRTFVGIFNAVSGGYYITVECSIIDQNNGMVGTMIIKTLAPWQFMSFNPFVEAGVGSGTYDNCWLYINVTASGNTGTGTMGLMCFGSSANNYTNDTAAHIAVQYK